jgi:hypothetical protein
MSLRISHSKFDFNLVDTNFTMVEQNNLFTDGTVSNYTYATSYTMSDKDNLALDFIKEHSATVSNTIFNVSFFAFNNSYAAVLEIEKIIGRTIEFQIRYGLENFPNYDRKLKELPLHNFELQTSIYEHAQSLIDTPGDYNFPQVFTEFFDTDSDQFSEFLGKINAYENGSFITNDFNEGSNEPINKNIIQPLPSLIYVIKQGLLEVGYELGGDIVNDPEFKNALIYSLSDYYSSIYDGDHQEMLVNTNEYIDEPFQLGANYETSIILETPGRYILSGNLNMRPYRITDPQFGIQYFVATAKLFINDVEIEVFEVRGDDQLLFPELLIEIYPNQPNSVLKFTSNQRIFAREEGSNNYNASLLDVTVTQIFEFDQNGNALPTLISPSRIDLSKCVPDITYGALFETIKKWKNFKLDIKDNIVELNYSNNLANISNVVDLSFSEIELPERTPNNSKSIELKFQDLTDDTYDFKSILFNKNGYQNSPYTKPKTSEEISIDAIYLPLKSKSGILTADGFVSDSNKLQLVKYKGLTGGLNTCEDLSNLNIPSIFQAHYLYWFNFLLNSTSYKWLFLAYSEKINGLNENSTVFAYGKYHLVNKLSRRNRTGDVFEIDIETESIF